MLRARRMQWLGVLCCLVLATSASADSWDATRKATIEPINSELHRHLPTFLRNRDLDGVRHLFTTADGTGLT